MSGEGVIKFRSEHQACALPAYRYGKLCCKLSAWREVMAKTQLVGQDPARYGGAGYGNVSARVGPLGTVREFTYNDQHPWPTIADGGGPSLVLINPFAVPDHTLGVNWRAGTAPGGAPGTSDSISFVDWKSSRGIVDAEGDPDLDGLNNFMEFALGTEFDHDSSHRSLKLTLVKIESNFHVAIDVRRGLASMDDAELFLESSGDLETWLDETADFTIVGRIYHADGTATYSHQATNPLPPGGVHFYRIRFQQR